MKKDLAYYMSLPYRVEIIKDMDEEGYGRMRLRVSRMQRLYGFHQHWKMETRFPSLIS